MRALAMAVLVIPLGLDLYLPVPEENPITPDHIDLGRRLFNDRRLSRDGSIACATCHDPLHAFADARPIAMGVFGRVGRRNAPALINRAYGRRFFWDGRMRSLEEQVLEPIRNPEEMDLSIAEAERRVGLPRDKLANALATYVRSILSGNAPYDRYVNGDFTALSAAQRVGMAVFRGKGNCTACHVGPTFTDEQLHNSGIAWRANRFDDEGGGGGRFKTPGLREVARSAPYMHDGSLPSLEDVVEFYDGGGRANPLLDAEIKPLHLTELEKASLVEFLRALTGDVR